MKSYTIIDTHGNKIACCVQDWLFSLQGIIDRLRAGETLVLSPGTYIADNLKLRIDIRLIAK